MIQDIRARLTGIRLLLLRHCVYSAVDAPYQRG